MLYRLMPPFGGVLMDFHCRSAVLGPVQKRYDSPSLPSIARKLTTAWLWGAIENSADRPAFIAECN